MSIKITHIKTTGSSPEHITNFKTEYGSNFTREQMYNTVKEGKDYAVNINPYPRLIAATSSNGTRYVRSKGDNSTTDDLMNLPRF